MPGAKRASAAAAATSVRGPGQNASTTALSSGVGETPNRSRVRGSSIRIEIACPSVLPLKDRSRSTAIPDSARAASPQTVSVGNATRPSDARCSSTSTRLGGTPTGGTGTESSQRSSARAAMSRRSCAPSKETSATALYARSRASWTFSPRAVTPSTRPPAVSKPPPAARRVPA